MKIKLIVTGTGRCGTTNLAKTITSMGLKCGHESIFNYEDEITIKNRIIGKQIPTLSYCSQGGIKTPNKWINPLEIEADSSYLAAPYLNWTELKNVKIIHLRRDPIKTISSFLFKLNYFQKKYPDEENICNKNKWENKIWENLPELYQINNPLERACYYYIKWNQLIIENSKNKKILNLKIEEENKIKKIKSFLKLNNKNKNLFENKKENNFNKINKTITISDIPEGSIKKDFKKEIENYEKFNFGNNGRKIFA